MLQVRTVVHDLRWAHTYVQSRLYRVGGLFAVLSFCSCGLLPGRPPLAAWWARADAMGRRIGRLHMCARLPFGNSLLPALLHRHVRPLCRSPALLRRSTLAPWQPSSVRSRCVGTGASTLHHAALDARGTAPACALGTLLWWRASNAAPTAGPDAFRCACIVRSKPRHA